MTVSDRKPTLDDIPSARVIVVGDIIRDVWISGTVDRISPEAPVPVFLETERKEQPGGAGNVSANLAALGITGHANVLLGGGRWHPPIKYRYVVSSQQIFRHDDEKIMPLQAQHEVDIMREVNSFRSAGCLILSDYGKGTLTPSLCQKLIAWAKQAKIPVVVDPKGVDWAKYSGCTVITPNEKEWDECETDVGISNLPYALVTRGARGMWLNGPGIQDCTIPATAREVFDVTGAGDTVVATLGACLAVGFDMETAARIANAAAGVVVGKRGTATCSLEELRAVYIHETKGCLTLSGPADAAHITVGADVTPYKPGGATWMRDRTDWFVAGPRPIPTVEKAVQPPGLRPIMGSEAEFWIKRVSEIVNEKRTVARTVDHWQKGWQENLDAYRQSGDIADLRPKYIRRGEPIRLNGKFWMPDDPDYEWNWYQKFFSDTAEKWLKDADAIYEMGCGSGYNVALLAIGWPRKAVWGYDWAPASQEIIGEMRRFGVANAYANGLDFFNPPKWQDSNPDAVFFTVGAMEQTGRLWRPMLDFFMRNRPKRVVHIEPDVALYDPQNPVDRTAIEAHRARGFWEGYHEAVEQLAAEGKAEVLERKRTGFGSLLIEGYSTFVWRPL